MFKCVYNPNVTFGTLVILGSSKEQLLDNIENEDDQLEGSVRKLHATSQDDIVQFFSAGLEVLEVKPVCATCPH